MPVHSFRFSVRLVRADYWLFLLLLLGVVLGLTIFAVTSGYFVSEKVLLVRERRLLADRETDVNDNRLNTDCLLAFALQ